MKKNYNIYSTYIKLLYKGIVNKSYAPKTNCPLYRGTRLEKFEVDILKKMLIQKKLSNKIPIIYSTSFLSFSTDDQICKTLGLRRLETSKNRSVIIKLNPLNERNSNQIMNTNGCLSEISFFHEENEVLFFPFSSFELVNIEEYSSGDVFIEFDYSLRFKGKVDNNSDNGICMVI